MIGWIDARAGASGDMLLGARRLWRPAGVMQAAIDQLELGITLTADTCERGGIGATKIEVHTEEPRTVRHLPEILRLLAKLDKPVRAPAEAVFHRLADAESRVHRIPLILVHFHEVGALDTLADVVGVVAGFAELGLDEVHCSPVTLGFGSTRGAHGPLPVPVPAVLQLLAGAPVTAGPVAMECTTPTGAALLAHLVTEWGELPPMNLARVGCGAGQRDPHEVANVVRLVLGEPSRVDTRTVVLESNVDDLDPRLWPYAIDRLLAAGAHDAWLTPILMKKGRPAHTLSVLCPAHAVADIRAVVFRETSTIGLRETTVSRKHALERTESTVRVADQPIRIKTAWLDGHPVNVNPNGVTSRPPPKHSAAPPRTSWPTPAASQPANNTQAMTRQSRCEQGHPSGQRMWPTVEGP